MNKSHNDDICSAKSSQLFHDKLHDQHDPIRCTMDLASVMEVQSLKGDNKRSVGCLNHQLWKQHDEIYSGSQARITA